jgi:hypothetical protein
MPDVDILLNSRKALSTSFAVVDVNTTGDNSIVTGVADEKIIIISIFLVATGVVAVTWKSGTTVILGEAGLKAGGGYHWNLIMVLLKLSLVIRWC